MDNFENYLQTAILAAQEAGSILVKHWGKIKHIEQKSFAWDLVTEADKESENTIRTILSNKYPSHTLLLEESGLIQSENKDYVWCVDPLDGTTNYTHQYPMVSVSIALLFQGEPVVGVTFNPIHNELFTAAKGEGAKLNHDMIHISQVDNLERSLLVTGFSYDRKTTKDTNYKEFCYLTHLSQGVRRGGSAALDLAYVAAGRLDGYWERGLQPWDIAAGIILVSEAGGKVSAYDQNPVEIHSGRILATNGLIHKQLSESVLAAKTAHFL